MSVRALVVDDDPSVREMLQLVLTLEGYDVVTAHDGCEALTATATTHPDVIVLDVMMPGIDGPGVAAALRADPELAGIPIVFCTALADAEEILAPCMTSRDAFIGKPFDNDQLLRLILAAVEGVPTST